MADRDNDIQLNNNQLDVPGDSKPVEEEESLYSPSDEEEQSEHGDTTDYENEIVYHWERLECGVVAYPAPLRIQCLLYIIGHCFNSSQGSTIPISSLSLLPRSIRKQLLLLLPAVDVCKLEGTPVTNDISMDSEIWEILFKERMPLHNKEELAQMGLDFCTPEGFQEEKGMQYSWKDAYFHMVLNLVQLHGFLDEIDCGCVYNHFEPDLLYGIYKLNPTSSELYQCFHEDLSLSIHGVYRCAQKCPVLTTENYYHKYESPAVAIRRSSGHAVNFFSVLDTMTNDCNVYPKYLNISKQHFSDIWAYRFPNVLENLAKSLAYIEGISIFKTTSLLYRFSPHDWEKITNIIDVAFLENKHLIKSLTAINCIDDITRHLTNSKDCSLKHIEMSFQSTDDELLAQILEHQRELETALFYFENDGNETIEMTEGIQCIIDLLQRPTVVKLTFDSSRSGSCSGNIVANFLYQFFSSPYPIHFSLVVDCPQIEPSLKQQLLQTDTQSEVSKSLELDGTYSPNLVSLFPSNLILKSLTVNMNVVSCLVHLESIKVETFILTATGQLIHKPNINIIQSLFQIVDAKTWDLFINIIHDSDDDEDHTIDMFISSISSIANRIKHLTLLSPIQYTLSILEPVFLSLDSSKPPYFVLGLSMDSLDVNGLYSLWEKCGSVKLKAIEFIDKPDDDVKTLLQEIALEQKYSSHY